MKEFYTVFMSAYKVPQPNSSQIPVKFQSNSPSEGSWAVSPKVGWDGGQLRTNMTDGEGPYVLVINLDQRQSLVLPDDPQSCFNMMAVHESAHTLIKKHVTPLLLIPPERLSNSVKPHPCRSVTFGHQLN